MPYTRPETTPKAKRVFHAGYMMRSILEARWASAMDLLGIRYLYEYKAFETSHGYYLPDFYLRDADTYVEIKPFTPLENEVNKVVDVAQVHGRTCFIVSGFPGFIEIISDNYESQYEDAKVMVVKTDGYCIPISFDTVLGESGLDRKMINMAFKTAGLKSFSRLHSMGQLLMMADAPGVKVDSHAHNARRNQEILKETQ